jgi:hypothetical protein
MRIRRHRPRSGPGPGPRSGPRPEGPARAGRARPFEAHMIEPAIDAAVDAAARRDVRTLDGVVTLLAEGAAGGEGGGGRATIDGAGADGAGVDGEGGRAGADGDGDGDGGRAAVDRALARRLLASLGDAWATGWQPADLARVVSRDLTRGHARLAAHAIVRESALYPPAAVPGRWREQVDDLASAHKLPRPVGDEAGWAVAPGADRAAAVRRAVELVALVGRLPAVPKLGAAPGEPGAAATAAPGDDVDDRMLQRVRALLAKAESTTFPEEAEALTAKAQELMARYAIDAAWVAAGRGRAPEVGGRRLAVDDPYAAAKAMLLGAIASANRCRSVWSKSFGYATVFGDEADLDGVELLYTSLLVQAARSLLGPGPVGRAGRAPSGGSAGRTRSYRQSFLVSFAVRIGDRLAEAVEAATAAASVSREALLPVLADRRRAAEAACDEAFPEVRATTVSARDWAGWHAGKEAAEAAQLDLHAPVARGGRRQLR